jgi:phenylalanyl-tRNA synthetase beta chain
MRVSESWLREWVNPRLSAAELGESLTLAGLECAGVEPVTPAFRKVVVGEVTALRPHPDADKLRIAEVNVGAAKPLTIVCGAPNVSIGMKAPTALVGAELPGGVQIETTKLRGQTSEGMLCSARELGLGHDTSGLMALPADAPAGVDLAAWLDLDDHVLDLELTPNRGDCLSVRGLAREISAITAAPLTAPEITPIDATGNPTLPIEIHDFEACPRYAGRIIAGIDPRAITPTWLSERLRRAGIRPIHPVVDVTQYVMLELGQPMHGFDLARLDGGIIVRRAAAGEKLTLLDGREVTLDPDVLVIADHAGAKAMAGIMGGIDSGVGDDTHDVFLESAYFNPMAIGGRARRFALHTDASHRYERGVDPALPCVAIERATELLLEIAGGTAGPVTVTEQVDRLPIREPIVLRKEKLRAILGIDVPDKDAAGILGRLGMAPKGAAGGWKVVPPSARFDLEGEHDLVEEVGRIYGYQHVPAIPLEAPAALQPITESRVPDYRLRAALMEHGYQEAITYSFIEPALEADLGFTGAVVALANPLSSELSQLRRSLWPGLLQALRHNLNHQQARVRLFEVGSKFIAQEDEIKEEKVVAGVAYGSALPEQWGLPARAVDFFDVKSDVEALLRLGGGRHEFVPDALASLHPVRAARIMQGEALVGWLGELHPALTQKLGLDCAPLLFELDYGLITQKKLPNYKEFSRVPAVRRDLAIVVDEGVPAAAVRTVITAAAGNLLRDLVIFDIYRGKGVDSGRKSVALGLILQESSRTLTDKDLDAVIARVLAQLEQELGATLRE